MNKYTSKIDVSPGNPRQPWGQQGASHQTSPRADSLIVEIQSARKSLLDAIEIAYGDTNAWPRVRALILRVFGKDGLEGAANKLLCPHSNKEVDRD